MKNINTKGLVGIVRVLSWNIIFLTMIMAFSGYCLAAVKVQSDQLYTNPAARYEYLERCFKQIRAKTDFVPDIALVLGSGLGDFANKIEVQGEIPYSEIKGLPVSTAPGHVGKFIYGTLNGKKIICMKGRVHLYEGYTSAEVVLPIRLMRMMGAKTLILTNAAGGLNAEYNVGDFMLLSDHISTFVPNPLIGANVAQLGTRFPAMSEAYDPGLRSVVRQTAADLGIKLHEGVYVQVTGASFESTAELKMFRKLGADAVGMSTVIEAIAAKHAGMRVCAISNISNMAYDLSSKMANEQEVIEAGKVAGNNFEKLLLETIKRI